MTESPPLPTKTVTGSVRDVARYYDMNQWLYNLGWRAGGTRSLHYGIWWGETRSLAEAIRNGDRFVAEKLAVQESDHVLDMGCGVGGTSVFLAKNYGCRVTGITISRVQLEQAKRHAAVHGVRHLVQFVLMDYSAMTFPDASFTKAFTQETANYAIDKQKLLREVHRILVPGGCYVSLDAFQNRDVASKAEAAAFRRIMRGWACDNLARFDRYVEWAKRAGLDVIEEGDITSRTLKSSRIIWRRHVYFLPLVHLCRWLRLLPAELLWHFQAAIEQKWMYCNANNLLRFGYLVARKGM